MSPDELGAWGQWAGAGAGLVAVWIARQVYVRDKRWRDSERDSLRGAQARTITSTVEIVSAEPESSILSVTMQNHGILPVTRVFLTSIDMVGGIPSEYTIWNRFDVDDPRLTPDLRVVLAPGDSYRVEVAVSAGKSIPGFKPERLEATIMYIDAEGIAWSRQANRRPLHVMDVFGEPNAD